jgi:hypothetical protein
VRRGDGFGLFLFAINKVAAHACNARAGGL